VRVGIYDPYLDTLGGGERYILSIASMLLEKHSVTLFWDESAIIEKAESKFKLSLKGLRQDKNIFASGISTSQRLLYSVQYDVIFYISDGSIPSLLSRKVVPIVQYPPDTHFSSSTVASIKLINTKFILCYSEFIKKYLDKEFNKPVHVLYPPVKKIPLRLTKEKVILCVGRFTRGKNTKKQEFLIEFFVKHKMHFHGWKLVFIGSVLEVDRDYVEDLKNMASGTDAIEFLIDVSYAVLSRYYATARIYWHAAGIGEDSVTHPEAVEHFGISIVEAMSAGCVPIVYRAGGPTEIITEAINGFFFSDSNDLFHKTKSLMSDARLWQKLSDAAIDRSEYFSLEKFGSRLRELL
jgi:glycosyltransferase involved in cell wall biosynthesis